MPTLSAYLDNMPIFLIFIGIFYRCADGVSISLDNYCTCELLLRAVGEIETLPPPGQEAPRRRIPPAPNNRGGRERETLSSSPAPIMGAGNLRKSMITKHNYPV